MLKKIVVFSEQSYNNFLRAFTRFLSSLLFEDHRISERIESLAASNLNFLVFYLCNLMAQTFDILNLDYLIKPNS